MFNLLSVILKYVFIIIIYLFIYSVIRLIYLDIRGLSFLTDNMSAYLELVTNEDDIPYMINEYYPLNRDLTMGRSLYNDIVLENPYISKRHLEVVRRDHEYLLIDLNSANGSFVNNKKVLTSAKLNDGDIISIGNIEFRFRAR